MPLSQSTIRQTPCSRKLCRNLFGPVDHEQLQNDFQDLMRRHLEEAQHRWNFDFEMETPLEGEFKWERVLSPDVSPVCLPSQALLSYAKGSDGENHQSSPALRISTRDLNVALSKEAGQLGSGSHLASSARCVKRKQTSIKDFYSLKRRMVPGKPNP
ncbi:cyclin-dependent kinase inhibitor 1 isoform X2 [Pelodiscus sinensis]|uniref:cyclin-dependent kinase inhibitor 1 isoform X2 n=1 Tax=Pelodiscus sinensis TaxID=13735 RepID=UPI0003C48413|nr:cyclin-dependent kinase inhibitor 1 [Pelodiscus sinensis]|eukprot:XP_006125354.1 cyclin-dependent kinase inhibitor 1 [Pelodiscus sinensis]